jgi:hypothetical protein
MSEGEWRGEEEEVGSLDLYKYRQYDRRLSQETIRREEDEAINL